MLKSITLTITMIALASVALAHSGVMNAAVKARMDNMTAISDEMKTLGKMSKQVIAFDADIARSAAATIAKHAEQTPSLFEAQEDDPKSEAKPEIWSNFADFQSKSDDLVAVASDLSQSISQDTDLARAMKSLSTACSACHKPYRE